MLGAGQRMRRPDEFTSALRSGRQARRGGLVIHYSAGSGEHCSTARAGFVIPRAVGPAVARNLVRRRLRHLLRDRLAGLPDDALVVVRALPGVAEQPFASLQRDLDAGLAAVTGRREGAKR